MRYSTNTTITFSALHLRRSAPFYETAERHRNENEGQADWIKLYKDESGIALFTPKVLAEMRGYIELAEAKLGVPPEPMDASRFQKRVQVVSEAFRLTELYADFDQSRRALVQACLDSYSPVYIETLLAQFKIAASDYRAYFEDYIENANYSPERRRIALNQSNPERLARGLIKPEPREFISQLRDPKLKHVGKRMRNFLGPYYLKLRIGISTIERVSILRSKQARPRSVLTRASVLQARILFRFLTPFPLPRIRLMNFA